MLIYHNLVLNYDTISLKGHYYDKNTSIKASWGTANDSKEIVRADRNKAKCHQ